MSLGKAYLFKLPVAHSKSWPKACLSKLPVRALSTHS